MKKKGYILVCAVLVMFLSCIEKKNIDVSVQAEEAVDVEIEQSILNIPLSAEEIMDLIYENDRYMNRFTNEIVFIEKANFGIPGGENWIARTSSRYISAYLINANRIEKQYRVFTMDYNLNEHTKFDIMREIPGTHIPNGLSSIGDFNGDGIDEIFKFSFGGMGNFISIWFYDSVTDDFYAYCSIPFRLIDTDNGPAPAEFMTYKGLYGFKVFFYQGDVAGGPDYVLFDHPDNNKWLFYTWDGEKREYVQVGEVIEEDGEKGD
jgi:hypothetical protein